MIEVLLNETNLKYDFTITKKAYSILGYNFQNEKEDTQSSSPTNLNRTVSINDNNDILNIDKNSTNLLTNSSESFHLDTYFKEPNDKFNIIFTRYKKIFLVMGKSIKAPKKLKFNHYQQLLKYI
jgi:hypothetical protein